MAAVQPAQRGFHRSERRDLRGGFGIGLGGERSWRLEARYPSGKRERRLNQRVHSGPECRSEFHGDKRGRGSCRGFQGRDLRRRGGAQGFEEIFEAVGNLATQTQVVEKRSEEHTSELQSQFHLVCRLLLEKK